MSKRAENEKGMGLLQETELYRILNGRFGPESFRQISAVLHDDSTKVKLRDENGSTYLHLLIVNTNMFDMRFVTRVPYIFSNAGIEVNAQDIDGETALHKAMKRNATQFIKALLRIGVDPTIKNKDEKEAIALIKHNPWDSSDAEEITEIHGQFYPGLWQAVNTSDEDTVEWLCQCWCRVNINKDGETLMGTAEKRGNTAILNILAKYEHRNEFVHATLARDIERMESLVMNIQPCDMNSYDASSIIQPYDHRPNITLMDAALPDPEAVTLLIENGVDVNFLNTRGPLFHYEGPGDEHVHRALLENANLALKDSRGRTVLTSLGSNTNFDISDELIEELLRKGVPIHERDKLGDTLRDKCITTDINTSVKMERRKRIIEKIDAHVLNLFKNESSDEINILIQNGYAYHIIEILAKSNIDSMTILVQKIEQEQDLILRLHTAARHGSIPEIDEIISTHPRLIMARDYGGRGILHLALLHERLTAAEHIVRHYPETLEIRDNMQRTALHYAVCLGCGDDVTISELLNKCGADTDAEDVYGLTAADYRHNISEYMDGGEDTFITSTWLQDERNVVYGEMALVSFFYRNLVHEIRSGNNGGVLKYLKKLHENGLEVNSVHKLSGYKIHEQEYIPLLFICSDHEAWQTFDLLLKEGADFRVKYQDTQCSCKCIEDPNSCVHYAKTLEEYGGRAASERIEAYVTEKRNEQQTIELTEKLSAALAYIANQRPLNPINELSEQILTHT